VNLDTPPRGVRNWPALMLLSTLQTPVLCPSCKTTLGDSVAFTWGMCPRAKPYNVGEDVQWLRDDEGEIAPPGEKIGEIFNVGRPVLTDVVVRDRSAFEFGAVCPVCEEVYAGVVTAIKHGRFAGASIFERGDLPTDDDVFEVNQDGSLQPHPEVMAAVANVLQRNK
jgi:hypothetical protein